jgi:hypothetical protein
MRLSDENWQNWAGAFIDRANEVIIDVTYLNDNLGWELKACRERLEPASLIQACCRNPHSDEDNTTQLDVNFTSIQADSRYNHAVLREFNAG